MKTVSISVDDYTLDAAAQIAAQQHTTVDALVNSYLKSIAAQARNGLKEQRAQARRELAKALASCAAEVGEKPTRERTYSDRRFSRH